MIHILNKVNSTNQWAFDNLTRTNDSILSFEQSEGRGRGNRSWISPFGGLYFSFLSERHQLLPFISGISIIQALPDLASELRLKWPNDIILNGKKLGGILCQDDGKLAVIGIGLNFDNTPPLPNSISFSDSNFKADKTIFLNDFLMLFKSNFLSRFPSNELNVISRGILNPSFSHHRSINFLSLIISVSMFLVFF